jgi:hypothetical protein
MGLFADLREHYSEQPHEVSIETQALCNARCTFCPYPTLDRIGTKMPDELLNRLLDEMATFKKPFYFSPFKVNEPFLDKRLMPLCQKFEEKVPHGVLRLFTNGSALTDKHIREVANLQRVAHLWISLNEHEAQAYEATMGLKFDHTAKRLDAVHEAVVAGWFPHPVVVSRVGHSDSFVAYCQRRWPRFQVATIRKDAWIDFTDPDVSEVPTAPCGRWWELNITATGASTLCCMSDGDRPEHHVGNVNTHTMLEVYNSEAMKARRAVNDRHEIKDMPCSRCSYG